MYYDVALANVYLCCLL